LSSAVLKEVNFSILARNAQPGKAMRTGWCSEHVRQADTATGNPAAGPDRHKKRTGRAPGRAV